MMSDMLNENLSLRKINLVGCKMKIYQERLKDINFLELVSILRDEDEQPDKDQILRQK
jgi:hypothetical protein